jgi:hypothetical protein
VPLASSIVDDGYSSPPSSRRTSETTKLPSIHELEKNIPQPVELHSTASSPSKRGSLATITEEIPPPAQPPPPPPPTSRPFPPVYPGTTIAAIPKVRSNSYPSPSNRSFPPQPPHQYADRPLPPPPPRESHSKRIAEALQFQHEMARAVESFEMVILISRETLLIVDPRGIAAYLRLCRPLQGLARPCSIRRLRTSRSPSARGLERELCASRAPPFWSKRRRHPAICHAIIPSAATKLCQDGRGLENARCRIQFVRLLQ